MDTMGLLEQPFQVGWDLGWWNPWNSRQNHHWNSPVGSAEAAKEVVQTKHTTAEKIMGNINGYYMVNDG